MNLPLFNLSQFLEEFLRELGELLEKAGSRNSEYEYFFRGEAKTHPDVRPSLYSKEYFIQNEDYLFKECLRKSKLLFYITVYYCSKM